MTRKQDIPGLGLVAVVAAVAFAIESVVKTNTPIVLSPLVVAVVLGGLISNLGLIPDRCRSGLRFAARSLLRLGIVLLGLQLSFSQVRELGAPGLLLVVFVVAITFVGTQWLGKKLGLSHGLSPMMMTWLTQSHSSQFAALLQFSYCQHSPR